MESIELQSSDDDENIYVNAVARLKALKNRPAHKNSKDNCNNEKKRDEEKVNEDDIEQELNVDPVSSRRQRKSLRKTVQTKNNYFTAEKNTHTDAITIQDENEHVITRHSMTLRSGRKKDRCRTSRMKHNHSSTIISNSAVNSEMIIIEDESDGEPVHNLLKKDLLTLNNCEDDNNDEINVKVWWRSNIIHRISMQKHDSFAKAFQYFADLEKVSIKQVLLMKQDTVIKITDTPLSLDLKIIDILDGGLLDPDVANLTDLESNQAKVDEDICNVTVQTENKRSLVISIRKEQPFKVVFSSCADQLGISVSNIKLYFDGEQVSVTDTPESLDLEREACMDLLISTK